MRQSSFDRKLKRFEDRLLGNEPEAPAKQKRAVKQKRKRPLPSISKVIYFSVLLLVFLLPLFFIPATFEYYELSKYSLTLLITTMGVLLWGINIVISRTFTFVKTPFDGLILLLIVGSVFSTIASIYTDTSIWGYHARFTGGLVATFGVVGLFYLIVNTFQQRRLVLGAVRMLRLGMIILAVITIAKSLGFLDPLLDELAQNVAGLSFISARTFSPIGNPAALSFLFSAMIPLSLLADKAKRSPVVCIVEFVIFLTALTIVSEPGVHLHTLFAFGMVITSLIIKFLTIFGNRGKMLLGAGFVVTSGLSLLTFSPSIRETILPDLRFSNYEALPVDADIEITRLMLRESGWKGVLIGNGPDTYPFLYTQYRPLELNDREDWQQDYTRGSSQILEDFQTQGVFGAMLTILIFLVFVFFCIRISTTRIEKKRHAAQLLGLALFTGTLLFSGIFIPHSAVIEILAWSGIALTMSMYFTIRKRDRETLEMRLQIFQSKIAQVSKVDGFAVLAFIVLFVIAGGILYFLAGNYLAEMYFRRSRDLQSMSEFAASIENITSAIRIHNERDYYYRHAALIAYENVEKEYSESSGVGEVTENTMNEIEQYLERATSLNGRSSENWRTSAFINHGLFRITNEGRFYDTALLSIERAISLNPYDPNNHILEGIIYLSADDASGIRSAGESLKHAYTLQPSYKLSILAYGNILESQQKIEDAQSVYRASLSYFPSGSDMRRLLEYRLSRLETMQAIEQMRVIQDTVEVKEELVEELENTDDVYFPGNAG